MQVRIPNTATPIGHPIRLMEHFVDANDWRLQHATLHEIAVEIPGHWSDYQLTLTWQDEEHALHLTAQPDIYILDAQQQEAWQVVGQLNRRLWLGHFDYLPEDGAILFRHTLPLRATGGATPEQLEDLVDIVLGECERAYPALFQIATGTASPALAVASAMMETCGTA